jgi:acetate kinase
MRKVIMPQERPLQILTINSGSSSVKVALYRMERAETLTLSGSVERIGLKGGLFHLANGQGESLVDRHLDLPDHDAALKTLLDWLQGHDALGQAIDAVGHRVVHGGREYNQPHLVSPELVATLKEFVPLAPAHLPHEVSAIQAVAQCCPDLPQVACFDTAFHRHMPDVAQVYALPRHLRHAGIIRYGFHGLSYEYILQELRAEAGPDAADGRVIVAHLGNGASMAAVRGGVGIDTTMGFTPTGGLVMGSRSGDLDPGVVLYLIEEMGMRPAAVDEMLNEHAGLVGVSGLSSSMKDLLAREGEDPHAAEAVSLFCYQAKKFLGALVAALGGLDTLVFTAGIGENAPAVRWRICDGLEFLDIRLDPDRNDANAPDISRDDSPVTVRVMHTNEALMIARHTRDVISQQKGV